MTTTHVKPDCVCGHPHEQHTYPGSDLARRCTHVGCDCPVWRGRGPMLPRRGGGLGPTVIRELPMPTREQLDEAAKSYGAVLPEPGEYSQPGRPTRRLEREAEPGATGVLIDPATNRLAMAALTQGDGLPAADCCRSRSKLGAACALPGRHRGLHAVFDSDGAVLQAWGRDEDALPAVRPDADREWVAELTRADGQIRALVEALMEIRDHEETGQTVRSLAWAAIRARYAPAPDTDA